MASSILRGIFRHGVCRSSNFGGHRMMSSGRMLPWLMLPPASDGGVAYRYYSLSEKKVVSIINQRRSGEPESESPAEDAEFVGSSHGWISSYNRRTKALFLSNPLTHRHIKLPPIGVLPDDEMNDRIGRGNVSKLILSSPSPEDESCRALMTFGPANRLAFCSPADCLSTSSDISIFLRARWTPMGDLYTSSERKDDETYGLCANVFEDMVYCGKRKAFCTITPCELDLDSIRSYGVLNFWNPWDPRRKKVGYCPIFVKKEKEKEKEKEGDTVKWVKENKGVLQHQCVQIPHIVYAEEPDQIYVALRFVILMNSDGTTPVEKVPLCEFAGLRGSFPSKTVGFMVLKVIEGAHAAEIVDDLGGLAMFVGINHSFALPAANYPGLKPDSVYFADSKRLDSINGRNDIGIFDYRNKTVTEIGIFTHHRHRHGSAMASPMWFTPHSLDS